MKFSTVCVFCGSSRGVRAEYAQAAALMGRTLARQHITLVYGGSGIGLMGIMARSALELGGRVTGIITSDLKQQTAHLEVSELVVTSSMHERKAAMYARSDAYIALPGGIGTMDELFECLVWNQLGIHTKPVGLLNTCGFFDPLIAWLEHITAEQFMQPEHLDMLVSREDPELLVDALESTAPEHHPKWAGLPESGV